MAKRYFRLIKEFTAREKLIEAELAMQVTGPLEDIILSNSKKRKASRTQLSSNTNIYIL